MLQKFIAIDSLTHSIKTAVACLIGFLLTRIISFPADQWVIITIIVVMCAQIYVGSVFQKSYFRFVGTFVGCAFAATAILALPPTHLTIALTIAVSSLIFSYIATKYENLSYAATLGAVTTTIIMLGQTPTLEFAIERFLEISIGILIATLVSQFFLPIHARTHLRRSQAATLEQLREYYVETMMTTHPAAEPLNYHELDEIIVKSLLKQRQLAKESAREPLGLAFDPEHFMQSLYCEREILRAITFMHNAILHIHNMEQFLTQTKVIKTFNDTIVQSLNTLIKVMQANQSTSEQIHIPLLTDIKQALQISLTPASPEELIYINGFLFSTEILINSLAKLAVLYGITVQ